MASGGVNVLPPAMTRSASRPTIFSTSTDPNFATFGIFAAAAGYEAGSSTFATIRSPSPRENRISVVAGVSDTILCGSALISTDVPSSSVTVSGNAAAADGDAVAVAAGTVEPVAVGVVVGGAAGDAQPPTTRASAAM